MGTGIMLRYLSVVPTLGFEITRRCGNEQLTENGKISIICFYISVPLYLIINYFMRNMKNKNNEKVKHVSTKYNKVVELNKKYEFKEIGKINRTIKEREYSHKSFDRARANSIILYQIENNVNNIRDFILDAYRNKKTFDNYIEEYSKIDDIISDSDLEQINFSRKKYNKIENRIIKEILYDKNVYNIACNI